MLFVFGNLSGDGGGQGGGLVGAKMRQSKKRQRMVGLSADETHSDIPLKCASTVVEMNANAVLLCLN